MMFRRVGAGLLLFLLLGGPSPGAVGECGADVRNEAADEEEFCRDFLEWIFIRAAERQEIDDTLRDDCRRQLPQICEGSRLPRCSPTIRQADACINALSAAETLETPFYLLPECERSQLCNAEGDDTATGGSTPSIEDLCPAAEERARREAM